MIHKNEVLNLINRLIESVELDYDSNVKNILRYLANYFKAEGAILWEIAPISNLDNKPETGYLFVQDSWFINQKEMHNHELPLNSITGQSIIRSKPIFIPSIEKNLLVYKKTDFWIYFNVKSFYTTPIKYSDGAKGAFNLYWRKKNILSAKELDEIQTFGNLIPVLFNSLNDRKRLTFIQKINNIIQEDEIHNQESVLAEPNVSISIHRLAETINKYYNCIETSIFLLNPIDKSNYKLYGTTWNNLFKKKEYSLNTSEGLTGWILTHKRKVRIFDLTQFERDKEIIQKEYPGISWNDSLDLKKYTIEHLDSSDSDLGHPLSFMASPIMVGEKIIGVIRCCMPLKCPYYFSKRDVDLVEIISTYIANTWFNWLNKREIAEENKSWKNIVEAINYLNKFAIIELNSLVPDEKIIFNESLKQIKKLIPNADILDIQLYDNDKRRDKIVASYGIPNEEITDYENKINTILSFSNLRSKDENIHQNIKTKMMFINNENDRLNYNLLNKNINILISVPLIVEKHVFGSLFIQGTDKGPLMNYAETILELLGGQIGVYYQLAKTIKKLKNIQNDHLQTFQDFIHQLRSPLIHTNARVNKSLEKLPLGLHEYLRYNLYAIRGLSNKANRVAKNITLFSDLANNSPIRIISQKVYKEQIIKILYQAAADNKIMVSPSRQLELKVENDSFEILLETHPLIDLNLFEQAINNLLDNAIKYSFDGTTIKISSGLMKGGKYFISVINQGLILKQNEIDSCKERNWRGTDAKLTTGEGKGIGLWIVDNIMKAHGGELVIIPTTSENYTEIKLIFLT